jgi:hypothetical protein
MEEKVTHVFKLNALRRRWGAVFDAVAAATLVIADDGELTLGEQSNIVVAVVKTNPVLIIGDLTTLVMAIADAIVAGERDAVVQMIERGKPREPAIAWATSGKMVEIVRMVRGLDDGTVERVLVVSKMIGEHPLMLGFPS